MVVKKLFIEEATQHPLVHSTVSSGADNGANNCLAQAFRHSLRHDTTQAAVDNWITKITSNGSMEIPLILSGHGSPGLIETGSGQSGYSRNSIITLHNIDQWRPLLSALKGLTFPFITMHSCSTGAGEDGADLLWEIAKIVDKDVRARTGIIGCHKGKQTYQPHSTWQLASPNLRPNAIPEPGHKSVNKMANNIIYFTTPTKEIATFDSSAVVSANVNQPGSAKNVGTLSSQSAQTIGQIILNDSIQESPGEILGILTSSIVLEVEVEQKIKTLNIEIYNDTVAIIREFNLLYYLPSAYKEFFK